MVSLVSAPKSGIGRRSFRLASFVAALFLLAQVVLSLHTHSPFETHPEDTSTEIACEVCLLAHMPADNLGPDHQLTPPAAGRLSTKRVAGPDWRTHLLYDLKVRAPPAA